MKMQYIYCQFSALFVAVISFALMRIGVHVQ